MIPGDKWWLLIPLILAVIWIAYYAGSPHLRSKRGEELRCPWCSGRPFNENGPNDLCDDHWVEWLRSTHTGMGEST